MSLRRTGAILAAAFLASGVALRLHNGWTFPLLAGYDAFGHFTYIWYLADTGRVPLPTAGWSFFHPPLYYGFMAFVWKALAPFDPLLRLRVGTEIVAALGLVHAAAAWRIASRRFAGDRAVAALAAGAMLLIPVQAYSAGFLGNEGLNAVLGTLVLLALLAVLARPTVVRSVLLGSLLGLGMLTKYSALALVVASLAALVARAISQAPRTPHLRAGAVAATIALAICGPHYARNVASYGTPFRMSRDSFLVAHVENVQPRAARGILDYVTFDPLILWRPEWPRGLAAGDDRMPHDASRAVRESVWTGLYANTWFDGFGRVVLPPVTESEAARRAGQVLLCLGLVPTSLMVFGCFSALRGLRRRGWEDETVAFAAATAAMLVLFVAGTRAVPVSAAVKATYFTPIALAFAYWLAVGAAELRRRAPRAFAVAAAAMVAGAAATLVVFWQGLVFDTRTVGSRLPLYDAALRNQYGIVAFAGGDVAGARAEFGRSADEGHHLGIENLAFLEARDGRPRRALRLLRRAAALVAGQSLGRSEDRETFARLASAEYDNSMAVLLVGLGRTGRAARVLERALTADPSHAEALLNRAVLRIEAARKYEPDRRTGELALARAELARARREDPGLAGAWTAAAIVEAATGNCPSAASLLEEGGQAVALTPRRFPVETGTGSGFSASIGRRATIGVTSDAAAPLASCGARPLAPDAQPPALSARAPMHAPTAPS